MTQASTEERFRQVAAAEDGMPISAGARVAHLRLALESGRALFVDLSAVPEDQRPAVTAEIKELVNRKSVASRQSESQRAADTSTPLA
jgi:hypothetical protein